MTASVFDIQERLPGRSYLAGLDHFRLRRASEVPAEKLLDRQITLYAFDDEGQNAVFVETPPEIDLTAAPFYYLAQKEHAARVYTLPYAAFNDLARTLPEPEHLILLYSVGRCGSTLLCRALDRLGDVVTLSEPDVYTHIAGMRPPDGSRDAELTELAGSAARFSCHNKTARQNPIHILKFRSQCTEMADLLHEACPNTYAFFLAREFRGWLRSMGRLSKIHDPDREASYRRNKPNLTMFGYPRDRYISLLRTDPVPPATRLEDLALHWTSVTKRFLDLHEHGTVPHSLTYDDLVANPERALLAVAEACRLPVAQLDRALEVFSHDSQAGTHLSGRTLREQGLHELSDEDVRQAEAVARRYGLEPDVAKDLPGNLLRV